MKLGLSDNILSLLNLINFMQLIVVEKLRSLGVNTTLQYLPRSLHGSLNIGSDLESDSSYYLKQNLLIFKNKKDYISQL